MGVIRAVFFDLDETLVDDEATMDEALALVCERLGPALGVHTSLLRRAYVETSEEVWREFGSVPRLPGSQESDGMAIRTYVWARAIESTGTNALDQAKVAAELYAEARRRTHRLFADALPALQALAGTVKLGVVTNGPGDSQREKLESVGLENFFDVVAISGELGTGKPDATIFEWALSQINVSAENAMHVGDRPDADVLGARTAGLTAVWLNRDAEQRNILPHPQAHCTVASLGEIRHLL